MERWEAKNSGPPPTSYPVDFLLQRIEKLFKIISQRICNSTMKLKIVLKLALAAILLEEKMSCTERKSRAIFQLCVNLGFLSWIYPIAEITINHLFLINRHLYSVL